MRVELKHDDYYDEGMRGCLYNMALRFKKQWPVRLRSFDMEDLMQEGRLVYHRCKMKYVGRPPTRRPNGTLRRKLPFTNPDKVAIRHFMRIVQRSFRNHLLSLLAKQTNCVKDLALTDLTRADQVEMAQSEIWNDLLPVEQESLSINTMLNQAPWEIRQLFTLLVNDAIELAGTNYKFRAHAYLRSGPKLCRRETNNQRFCRLLGLHPDYDLSGAVEKYFFGSTVSSA